MSILNELANMSISFHLEDLQRMRDEQMKRVMTSLTQTIKSLSEMQTIELSDENISTIKENIIQCDNAIHDIDMAFETCDKILNNLLPK